ncbi:hypothetical protein [Microbacterium sp. NPDC057650]|uniref:hypothetical protein n=1 Tax=unclassified Microbacterium TaxID=2609290 RepID=UPI003671833B
MPSSAAAFDPVTFLSGILFFPPIALLAAIVIAGGILLFRPRPRTDDNSSPAAPRKYTAERRAISVVALAIVALFIAEFIERGYIITDSEFIHWWRFATPLAAAAVGISVVLAMILTRGSQRPEQPIATPGRRTWTSFSTPAAIVAASVVSLALIVTTLTAGFASSPNSQGLYVWLEIPIANEPSIRPILALFYGWSYGVPVLICTAALGALAWAALDRNAARPFSRPETIAAERAARRTIAAGVTQVATAAMLLTLSGAWWLIARAGSGTSLTILGDRVDGHYDATWRYAELAVAAGWLAPILETAGLVVVLVVAGEGFRRARPDALAEADAPIATAALR